MMSITRAFAPVLPASDRRSCIQQRVSRPAPRSTVVPRALPAAHLIAEIAAGAPGTVDAPIGVIVGGAILVTAASLLLSLGLKPGTDAAIKMQERDAKSGRYRK